MRKVSLQDACNFILNFAHRPSAMCVVAAAAPVVGSRIRILVKLSAMLLTVRPYSISLEVTMIHIVACW
jgi:hypothetical protein